MGSGLYFPFFTSANDSKTVTYYVHVISHICYQIIVSQQNCYKVEIGMLITRHFVSIPG